MVERPAFLVGNLMGDFVKGRLEDRDDLAPELIEGIRLHRAVDSFTDRHPVFRRSRARLRPSLRRYGGIVVDILYDHLLAGAWDDYCRRPLGPFSQSIYATLQTYYHDLPDRMQRTVRYMQATDLLTSYRDAGSVELTLWRVERRLRRPAGQPLAAARADLDRQRPDFDADFAEFFAQLIAFADHRRRRCRR